MCCRIFLEKTGGKRPLGSSRHRWESNIKLYLTEIRWEGMDFARIGYKWRTPVNTEMNFLVFKMQRIS